jgi:small subunit ribosomal protein S27Ae
MARHELYNDDGSSDRQMCPKCGDTFLADHGDRLHCGKCDYAEWT